MTQKITIDQISDQKEYLTKLAKQGAIFVYPTDTIYGIGGIATSETAKKINKIKQRPNTKKLSCIAPSFDWIKNHCQVDDIEKKRKKRSENFDGITVLCEKKDHNSYEHIANNVLIGLRYFPTTDETKPEYQIQNLIKQIDQLFISTSVNISGSPYITSIDQIEKEILKDVDIIIDAGSLNGKPSTLILESNGKIIPR